MAVLALFALLVLGLSSARAENCVTISFTCSKGILHQADQKAVAAESGDAGWSGMLCGNMQEQLSQLEMHFYLTCGN